jgi:hypothetical protein
MSFSVDNMPYRELVFSTKLVLPEDAGFLFG